MHTARQLAEAYVDVDRGDMVKIYKYFAEYPAPLSTALYSKKRVKVFAQWARGAQPTDVPLAMSHSL